MVRKKREVVCLSSDAKYRGKIDISCLCPNCEELVEFCLWDDFYTERECQRCGKNIMATINLNYERLK